SYVDRALRGGVNKIVLVRPDYDNFTGRFLVSYTNQFTDTYMANATIYQQQLERVITQPDILFSSADLSGGTSSAPRFVRTGTTNWLSSAGPGADPPGVIQRKVQINLPPPIFHVRTHRSATGRS